MSDFVAVGPSSVIVEDNVGVGGGVMVFVAVASNDTDSDGLESVTLMVTVPVPNAALCDGVLSNVRECVR